MLKWMATPAQAPAPPAPPAPPATTEAAIPAAAGAAVGLEMQHVWSPGFFLLFPFTGQPHRAHTTNTSSTSTSTSNGRGPKLKLLF